MSIEADAPAGTRLVLVRHGEAHCNVEEFIGGEKSCKGLTTRGAQQAELLAARIGRTGELDGVAALWSSVLPRAVETAKILAPALGIEEAAIERTRGLSEREPGEADGLTWAELAARYGRDAEPGLDPELPLSPGGESWIEFVARASAALIEVAERAPGRLLVIVTHGGVIDASLISFLGLPEHGGGVRLHPEHTSLSEWRSSGSRWRLVRYNDAAHLGEPSAGLLRSRAPDWLDR